MDREPSTPFVARIDRYRYALMEWLKHCSIDYLREGLSDIFIDNYRGLVATLGARLYQVENRNRHAVLFTTPFS